MTRVRSQFSRSACRLSFVLVAAMVLAAPASAAATQKGVIDHWSGKGTLGGLFSERASGVAVNDSTGDVYLAESSANQGGNRVHRLSADGVFISAWGKDTVQALLPGDTGTGFEVCTIALNCKAATNGALGGEFNTPGGIAIDQATGNVYVTERTNNRVQVFTASGGFLRAFGRDVVSSGSAQADEQQTLTVNATAGQFRLTFGANTTGDLEFDATAAQVQAALNGLASISAGGGSVSVTGGPGGAGGATPYRIAFDGGPRADVNQNAIAVSAGTTPLSGGAATATVATLNDGAVGFEVCTIATTCKAGTSSAATGGSMAQSTAATGGVSVAPVGAANAGNVLVADPNNNRVQEFTAAGEFVRAFGWDVVAAGPGNSGTGFEVCRAASLDVCKAGVSGSGVGQFARVQRVAQKVDGEIYAVDSGVGNFRVQRFTPSGGSLTPSLFNPAIGTTGEHLTGTGDLSSPQDVAVGPAGSLLILRAVLEGGGDPVAATQEGRVFEFDSTGQWTATHGAGVRLALPQGGIQQTGGLTVSLATGKIVVAAHVGVLLGTPPGVFVLGEVPPVVVNDLSARDVGATSATLAASIEPAALPLHTFFKFEHAKAGTDDWVSSPPLPEDIGDGSGTGDPATCPHGNPDTCQVTAELSSLELGVTYKFRVVAYTEFNELVATVVDGGEFTTARGAPVVRTGDALWSSPQDTDPSLLFTGRINPSKSPTTYRFEYVDEGEFAASGFDGARSAPASPASAGEGGQALAISQNLPGLDSTRSYRFRLVATNSVGTSTGDVGTVHPPDADGMYYERVSDGDSWGGGVSQNVDRIAVDGNIATFKGIAFGSPPSLPGPANPFTTSRTATGWKPTPMLMDAAHASDAGLGGASFMRSSDLTRVLWPKASPGERMRGEVQFATVGLDGAPLDVTGPLAPLSSLPKTGLTYSPGYTLLGASGDLTDFVFAPRTDVTLLPDEVLLSAVSNIYSISGAGGPNPTLHVVNRADGPAGAIIGGRCGASLGAVAVGFTGGPRAVSADGSVMYFTAQPDEPNGSSCPTALLNKRVYKRIDNTTTVAVSASQCTRTASDVGGACTANDPLGDVYQGASVDGSVVAFLSMRQLVGDSVDPGDTDATTDLYLYDATPPAGEPNLVMASAGEVVAGDHPTIGSGANVQGVVDVSADGSRVYFVALGALAGANARGESPVLGRPNLYVFERGDGHPAGQIEFVAGLDGAERRNSFDNPIGDPLLWDIRGSNGAKAAYALPAGQDDGDGRFLLFTTFAALVAGDDDGQQDAYRYDDTTGDMECLSCSGDGPFDVDISARWTRNSEPDAARRAPAASDDAGTVVFVTPESLVAEDTNRGNDQTCTSNGDDGRGCDVYAWRDGELILVTGGADRFGAAAPAVPGNGVSGDGESVFFTTRAPLVAGDANGVLDLYVARIGGGFPDSRTEPVACDVLGDACQRPGEDGESVPDTRTDPGGSGGGNAVAVERTRLGLAKVGAAARKRAARTGVLELRVRASREATVSVVARSRIGKRVRKVGSSSAVARPGRWAVVRVRLGRGVRARLKDGKRVRVSVQITTSEARQRAMTISLRRSR
jgi:NHL repeat-containing protein